MAKNAWMAHVKQFRKQNPGLEFKELLKQARNTYQGGASYQDSGVASNAAKFGGEPVEYISSGVAANAGKVGGDPSGYESNNLASRSAKFGGRRQSKRQSRRQSRKKKSRRRQ
jgi:hypothetical protein